MPRVRTRETWSPWTPEDSEKLYNLGARHKQISISGWAYIASHFPTRTVVACKQQFGKLKAKALGKPERERDHHHRRKVNTKYVIRAPDARDPLQTPQNLPPPSSLTAYLCGDPLPGRSALDKKNEGLHA